MDEEYAILTGFKEKKRVTGSIDFFTSFFKNSIKQENAPFFLATMEKIGFSEFTVEEIGQVRDTISQNKEKHLSNPDVIVYLGILEKKLGSLPSAKEYFLHALQLDANHKEALRELAFLSVEAKVFQDALIYFSKICQIDPKNWRAWNNGGCALWDYGKKKEALSWMLEACKYSHNNVTLFVNVAQLKLELSDYESVQEYLDKALSVDPKNSEALHTQAMLVSDMGEHSEAYEYELKALTSRVDYSQVRFGMALSALIRGDFLEGFAGYEHRWGSGGKRGTQTMPTIQRPQWFGQRVYPSSTIAILPEQGFGDLIHFAQLIPRLTKYFYKIKWVVMREMYSLISYNFQSDFIDVSIDIDSLDATVIDYELPIMSLPLALGLTIETVNAKEKYLDVPTAQLLKSKERLKDIKGLKVGIAWTGESTHNKQKLRSVDPMLLGILEHPEITFVSLQKFSFKEEIGKPSLKNFYNFMDECNDFLDTAALISNLDLVISVDTVIAHLSAALGKETWLLNRLGSEWRWLDAKESSPWYPTMKIFNQTQLKNWEEVLYRIKQELVLKI